MKKKKEQTAKAAQGKTANAPEKSAQEKNMQEKAERGNDAQENNGGVQGKIVQGKSPQNAQEQIAQENDAQDKDAQENNGGAQETEKQNHMRLEFDSLSENEGFARVAVAAFMTQLNPTVEEVDDVKTAVSEAVTNCIIHGYEGRVDTIVIRCGISGDELSITVEDRGVGIPDVKAAMEPLYTSKPELERSGMGFAFMEAFMDTLQVDSAPGRGTVVHMKKKIGTGQWGDQETDG